MLSLFWSEFDSYLAALSTTFDKFILCGDFNFHLQKNSPDVTKLLNILSCYGFRPLTDYDRHATHCKGSVLDAFFIHGGYKPNLHGEFLNNLQVIDKTGTDSDHYHVRLDGAC